MAIRRHAVVTGVMLALVLAMCGRAGEAGAAIPGSPCANGQISTLNQYCEVIPSATGPQAPSPGAPVLGAGSVPPAGGTGAGSVRPLGRVASPSRGAKARANASKSRAQARNLLARVPAPVRSRSITAGSVSESPWSISPALDVLLVALALIAAGVAAYTRRNREKADLPAAD